MWLLWIHCRICLKSTKRELKRTYTRKIIISLLRRHTAPPWNLQGEEQVKSTKKSASAVGANPVSFLGSLCFFRAPLFRVLGFQDNRKRLNFCRNWANKDFHGEESKSKAVQAHLFDR